MVTPAGVASTLATPVIGLLGAPREIAVSPDGTRIVMRTGSADPTRPGPGPREVPSIWLGRIAGRNGTPTAEGWVEVASGLDQVGQVSWSSPTELTVTGRREGSPSGLWRFDLGRLTDPVRIPTEGLPTLPGVVSAAPGRSLLVLAAGRLWRLDGERWTDLAPVRAVAQPH
jgi:hypothetical protein